MPEVCYRPIYSVPLDIKLQGFLYELQGFSTELYKVCYRGTRFAMKDRYSGVTNQITAFVTTRI